MVLGDSDIAFALELFEPLGDLTTRRMFGGMALYHQGVIFALLRSDATLLLKAEGDFRARLEAEGWDRWTHTRKNGTETSMPYYIIPGEVLDDPESASDLARASLESR